MSARALCGIYMVAKVYCDALLACCWLFGWRFVGLCLVVVSCATGCICIDQPAISPPSNHAFVLCCSGLTPKGMQPFSWPAGASATDAKSFIITNGEIYNFHQLAELYGIPLTTGSDCEVLLPVYDILEGDAVAWARSLDGVFASVLVDKQRGIVVVARDPYGVRPLYTGVLPPSASSSSSVAGSGSTASTGSRLFASEIKGLVPAGAVDIAPFPPGHVATYDITTGQQLSLQRYHTVPWVKNQCYADAETARAHVRVAFEAAVEKRLLSDRPIGCLLSGGLDSSLVAALVQRYMKARGKTLQTFSIGMRDSTDLLFARKVAAHIGSQHHGE